MHRLCAVSVVTLVCTVGVGCTSPSHSPDAGSATSCTPSDPPPVFSDTGRYTRELYVDRVHGNDDNDGSQAHPWRTLARAATDRSPGDRVHILPGTYFECLHVERAQGTEQNPIAFVGDGPRRDIRIHCQRGEAIWGTALAYVTFENVTVLASSDEANAIHVDGDSHHVVIRRNEVAGVGRGGDCIKVNHTDDVWILDNDLHNADTATGSAQGIDLVAVHRGIVRNNHVHDIANSQGMFAKGGSSDVVFERNLVERLVSVDGNADTIGIVLGGVTDRRVFVPPDAPYEATRIIARNNIVIAADGAGIGAQGCHDCWIVNNTLWHTGRRGYAIQLSQGATGLRASSEISVNMHVRVINNLVGNPWGTLRAPIQAERPHRTGLELSHNWWWNGDRDDVPDPGYNHEIGVDEPNSHLDENPLVIEDERFLPRLSPQSPARGAGRTLNIVTDDFEGRCRRSPPDIGALNAPDRVESNAGHHRSP